MNELILQEKLCARLRTLYPARATWCIAFSTRWHGAPLAYMANVDFPRLRAAVCYVFEVEPGTETAGDDASAFVLFLKRCMPAMLVHLTDGPQRGQAVWAKAQTGPPEALVFEWLSGADAEETLRLSRLYSRRLLDEYTRWSLHRELAFRAAAEDGEV